VKACKTLGLIARGVQFRTTANEMANLS